MDLNLSYSVLKLKYQNFMTPVMVLKINHIPVSKLPGIYVSQVQVQLSLNAASSASFTLEKVYNLTTRDFSVLVETNFKLGNIISIELGYGSVTEEVFYGYIHEITYSYSDTPSISVTAMDICKLMMINKQQQTFNDMSYSAIFMDILSKYGPLYSLLKVDLILDKEKSITKNGTDYEFIKNELCVKANKEFLVLGGTVYFQERNALPITLITLAWGENLFDFEFRKTYSNGEIIVYGINEKERVTVKEKVKSGDSKSLTKTPLTTEIVEPSTSDKKKLQRIAESQADKKNAKSKTGSGSCIGLPELVPGRLIKIENLGVQTGALKSYISSVKHSFSANGFTTQFELGGD